MFELTLFNFILNNFQLLSIQSAVILHCWEPQAIKILAQRAAMSSIYGQFGDLKQLNNDFLKHQRPIVGVFVDMNCLNAETVLNGSSQNHLYNDHYHWLLYDRSGNIEKFRLLFEKANVTVNSDVTYVIPTENLTASSRDNVNIKSFLQYDVYNNGPHIGGKLNMTLDRIVNCTVVKCRVAKYLTDLHKRTKYGNRNRQSDIKVRVSTVITRRPLTWPEEKKIEFLLTEDEPNIDAISRFGYHQIGILKDMLQCGFVHIWRNSWSVNDTHGGLIGDLRNETVEILSSPMVTSANRLQFVVAAVESGIFHSICMFRTPRKTGLRSTGEVYLDPFSTSVWLVFVIVIVIVALQLWGIFRIERRGLSVTAATINPTTTTTAENPTFLTSLLITFGTVCAQGTNLLPATTGGRISYSALVLASFIMYNYYTSVIVSTLLGAPLKSDIKTLAQLAESNLEVGFEPIPFNFAYLNASAVPAVRSLVRRKIESRKNPQTAYLPAPEGIKRVRDQPGKFAYVFEGSTGYAVVERMYEPNEICDLNEILLRPEQNLNNVIHKNSSFVELFRLRLLRMLETGINRRNVRYWLRNRLYCFHTTKIVSVGLEYTAPLFFLLLVAFILAGFILCLEIIWHKIRNLKVANEHW